MLRKIGLAIVGAALVLASSFDAQAYQIRVSTDGITWSTSAVYNAANNPLLFASPSVTLQWGTPSLSILNSYVGFTNNTGVAGSLYAQVTESFTMDGWSPSASISFSNNLIGAGPTSANISTYFGSSAYSTANLISSSGLLGGNFSTSLPSTAVAGLVLSNGPFFLTQTYELTLGAFSSLGAVSQATVTAVPEPGTIVLLGAGMLGLAVFGKRRMKKA